MVREGGGEGLEVELVLSSELRRGSPVVCPSVAVPSSCTPPRGARRLGQGYVSTQSPSGAHLSI